MKKALFIFLLLFPAAVYASATDVRITEIMYDAPAPGSDTGREWVELWNGGSETVTIVGGSGPSGWRFNDGENHLFPTTPTRGSLTLAPGDFLIISSNPFLVDYSNFSGNLVKVSFSLGNTNETLSLRIGTSGALWSEVSYSKDQGADGNGKTLEWNRETGAWSESVVVGGTPGNFGVPAAAPTPPPPAETPASEPDAPTTPEQTAETVPPPPPASLAAEPPTAPAPIPDAAIINEAEPEEPIILADIPVADAASPQTVSGSEKLPKPASSLTPLLKIRELKLNARVRVRGTVIATPTISTGQIFYISDDQAGVQVYSSKKDFPALAIGGLVEITGTVGEANGERRVRIAASADIKKIGTAHPPQPVEVSVAGFGDELLGRLVRIRGAVVARTGTGITVEDASGETAVGSARLQGLQLGEGDTVAVVGVLGRTRSGYRLLPRGSEDVSVTARAAGAKPPASPKTAWPAASVLLGGAAVSLGLWGRKDMALRAFRAMHIFFKKK